jgi:hypothetical protein
MKGVFVLLFVSVVFSKVMAQTTIARKGTMKVRKTQTNPPVQKEVEYLDMERYGANRAKKDSLQRARLERQRKRKREEEKAKNDSLKKSTGQK